MSGSAYYLANREELRRKQAEYYRRNAEMIKARVARNRAANPEDPEAHRQRSRDYYRRKRAAEPTYYAEKSARRRALEVARVDLDYVWARDFGVCHICGQGVDRTEMEYDHVVPLSRGGTHSEENLRTSHRFCNRSKGTRLLEEMVA